MMDNLDVKRDDLNYTHLYGDATSLMGNAAARISEFVRETFGTGIRICAVCGTGNNAGDGIAALEKLRRDNDVCAVLLKGRKGIKTTEGKWALNQYRGRTAGAKSIEDEIARADVILDCMFGIGISGEPREPYASAIEVINTSGKKIVSVDVPSGLGTSNPVKPAYTVTFTDVKKGMSKENSGSIVVSDIGIPDSVRNFAGPGDLVYFLKPDPSSHKGMNGTLSIVGGWEFYGSAVIAGLGANATGNDLVRIYTTGRNYGIIASYSPYLIVRNIEEIGDSWRAEARGHGAMLIGPGMGTRDGLTQEMLPLAAEAKCPVVVDADGIRILSRDIHSLKGTRLVFTPHRKEFETLTGKSASEENASDFAAEHRVTILLKGPVDIVTDGTRTMHVQGGNARMTMGGTGDLLAGIVSAIASRGVDPFRAAVMGSYINKKTAEMAFSNKSYWYGIDDMISSIPAFMRSSIAWAGE